MKDGDFERILEGWAEHETRSAPEMKPTPVMYRMVRGYKEEVKPSSFFRRRLALSMAAAALLVLTVICPAIFRPPPGPSVWSGRELELVGLREMPMPKKGAARAKEISPKRGPKKEAYLFRRLEFQFKPQASTATVSIDVRGPREETVSLTPAGTYRLLIEPVDDIYTYVFQLSPLRILLRLFPNDTYSPHCNPLGRGIVHYLPPEPNWFHIGNHSGEERIYVLASMAPLTELEGLYAEYTAEALSSRRAAILSDLLKRIEDIMAAERGGAAGWMFPFQHR